MLNIISLGLVKRRLLPFRAPEKIVHSKENVRFFGEEEEARQLYELRSNEVIVSRFRRRIASVR